MQDTVVIIPRNLLRFFFVTFLKKHALIQGDPLKTMSWC